jgi:lysophospholipase L1-like esterase
MFKIPSRLRVMLRRVNTLAGVLAIVVVVLLGYRFYDLVTSGPTNAEPVGTTIVCFGDSLTYGTGASADESYPAQLRGRVDEPVINAGIPGDTTSRALTRLEQDVLSRDPRIVLITLGGNDLKNGVPREEAFDNLATIVQEIQAEGALVVVGGIDVPLYGRGYPEAYRELCKHLGCVLIANVYEGIWGRNDLMSDRIHPNGDGYEIMADRFYEAIEPYVD